MHSTSIGQIFMVPQGWCTVGWEVVVRFEVITPISINILIFVNLVWTFMSKSLFSNIFLLNTFHNSHLIP